MASFQEFKDRPSPRQVFLDGEEAEQSRVLPTSRGPAVLTQLPSAGWPQRPRQKSGFPGRALAGALLGVGWRTEQLCMMDVRGVKSKLRSAEQIALLPLPAQTRLSRVAEALGVWWGKLAGVKGSSGKGSGPLNLNCSVFPGDHSGTLTGVQRIRVQSEKSSN